MSYEVIVIHDGYSYAVEEGMKANCTCTLIKGKYNVIVDTMTPWDKELILKGLEENGVQPDDIDFVVSTHGHSDHFGNNHLFLNSTHIVGYCISKKDLYFDDPFGSGKSYVIDGDDLKIIATPGHTLKDITVLVKTRNKGIVAVTGKKIFNVFELYEGCIHHTDLGKVMISTCTLIKGPINVIVNTMLPTNREIILRALKKDHDLEPKDIHYVVSTNGEPGNIGNNNLFLDSVHIVGHSISKKDIYGPDPFNSGNHYELFPEYVKIMPTPGHTLDDISVIVHSKNHGIVAITGELFAKKEDLCYSYNWLCAGTECPSLQINSRREILSTVHKIVPAYGPMFDVTDMMIIQLMQPDYEQNLLTLKDYLAVGLI